MIFPSFHIFCTAQAAQKNLRAYNVQGWEIFFKLAREGLIPSSSQSAKLETNVTLHQSLIFLCRIIYIQKWQCWRKIFRKFKITLPSTITVGRVRDSWRKEPVMRNREICCGKRTGCFVSYESGATDSFSTLTQRRYRFLACCEISLVFGIFPAIPYLK